MRGTTILYFCNVDEFALVFLRSMFANVFEIFWVWAMKSILFDGSE